jgi:hypothetical protein
MNAEVDLLGIGLEMTERPEAVTVQYFSVSTWPGARLSRATSCDVIK